MRENAGFQIIFAIPIGKDAPFGEMELAVGYRDTSLGGQYVCWFCQHGVDYFWGRYTDSYAAAMDALRERLAAYYPEERK